jgi:outer membrane lipoprotein SlyB
MKEKPDKDAAKNVDPLTGEPGAHPVGAGAGAAGGGVAGAAIGGGRSRA